MAASERVRDDLAYVRGAMERAGNVHAPTVYLMWAAICLVGFSMPDFITNGWVGLSYNGIGWYWAVMGPAGFLASWWLRARRSDEPAQRDTLGAAPGGFRGHRSAGHCSRANGACGLGSIWSALGAAAGAFLYAGGGALRAADAGDRADAGSGLPGDPVPAPVRVDSRRGSHCCRADGASLHRRAV